MVWWGENALDWEREAWQRLQKSEAMADMQFLERLTNEENKSLHNQLSANGWELHGTGSGWMWRISVYKKKI